MPTLNNITFREPAWVLMDRKTGDCLTTIQGNLAIFSTQRIANIWAEKSDRDLFVQKIDITPID